MAETMTPSKMVTDGQIEKLTERLAGAMRKVGLNGNSFQGVLERQAEQLLEEMMEVVKKRVNDETDIEVHTVTGIDRTRTPQEVIATCSLPLGRFSDQYVVETMPRGTGDSVKIALFPIPYGTTAEQLGEEYKSRGVSPIDPVSLLELVKSHPEGFRMKDIVTVWPVPADGEDSSIVCSYEAIWDTCLAERRVDIGLMCTGFQFSGNAWWAAGLWKG